MADIASLNRQFGIAGIATFDADANGLTRLVIHSEFSDTEIYLHGAHVTRFQPRSERAVLFISGKSLFQSDKPIRGGVPICFPWFGPKAGDAKAPAHGFARLVEWSVDSVARADSGDVVVSFLLKSNDATAALWPAEFIALYTVTVGRSLHMSLAVTNHGTEPIQFEEALHTYLSVGDVRQVQIDGLEGTAYLDKMNNAARTLQGKEGIKFIGETDRVYLATKSTCTVKDPVLGRTIAVEKTGSDATVVWNPWINKAKAMADFGDDEWPGMVCVETCNVAEHAVKLNAGATHTMSAKISVLK